MMFAIRCAGDVIGHSEFEHEDLSMAVVFGAFRPTDAYEEGGPGAYEAQVILRDAAAWPPTGHSIPRP